MNEKTEQRFNKLLARLDDEELASELWYAKAVHEERLEATLWRDLGLDLNADYDSPTNIDNFDFDF